MVQPLTFVSDFSSYPYDPPGGGPPYPPGHPNYQHQTTHLLVSGDYGIAGVVYLINDVVYFNHPAGAGGGALHVDAPDGDPGTNSYTMWADYAIVDPGTRSRVVCMATTGLRLHYARNGSNFAVDGQLIEHSRSLGGYSGGHLAWHIEVDPPSGLWYCEVTTTPGGLAYQACGLHWDAGLIRTANFGQGNFAGFLPNAQLTTRAIGGDTAVRTGLPDCPIPPEGAGGARTHVLWVPWGD